VLWNDEHVGLEIYAYNLYVCGYEVPRIILVYDLKTCLCVFQLVLVLTSLH